MLPHRTWGITHGVVRSCLAKNTALRDNCERTLLEPRGQHAMKYERVLGRFPPVFPLSSSLVLSSLLRDYPNSTPFPPIVGLTHELNLPGCPFLWGDFRAASVLGDTLAVADVTHSRDLLLVRRSEAMRSASSCWDCKMPLRE